MEAGCSYNKAHGVYYKFINKLKEKSNDRS